MYGVRGLVLLLLFSAGGLAQEGFWRGLYRAGAEVNSFQPCPGNLVYWVDGGGPVALSLREYALKHVQRPYQPFYVEMVGELLGRRADAGLTHQCLYFEQPHTFEQILFIQTAEPALVGHA